VGEGEDEDSAIPGIGMVAKAREQRMKIERSIGILNQVAKVETQVALISHPRLPVICLFGVLRRARAVRARLATFRLPSARDALRNDRNPDCIRCSD